MKPRRNILFITNRLPFPPDKGDKIRTFHQLEHLALSHDVYCACFVDSERDVRHAPDLARFCKGLIAVRWQKGPALLRAAAGLLRGETITAAAYRDDLLLEKVRQWAHCIHFDAAVAFSTIMAPYALAVPAGRRVLDMCDVDSEKWSDYARGLRFPASALCRREARRLRDYERTCLEAFDATIFITEQERHILEPSVGNGGRTLRVWRNDRLHVIPNGVRLADRVRASRAPAEPVVGFLGSMDYRPNVEGICWFVRRVWPEVVRYVPRARLLIIGRNPTARVRRLSRSTGVRVTGEVADVHAYLERCRIMVAPLHIARGLQNKVLEAMAMSRPVVATSAVAGCLKAEPGHHILVADEAERFAEKVVDLCRFDGLCESIGEAGRRCVATHYCWAQALADYERVVLGEGEEKAQKLPKRTRRPRRQRVNAMPVT